MERDKGLSRDELITEVTLDGINLIVIANKIENEEWQLSIQNEYGVASCWIEYFPTAQNAINAGLLAIQNEGVEEFANIDGFEYLDDINV